MPTRKSSVQELTIITTQTYAAEYVIKFSTAENFNRMKDMDSTNKTRGSKKFSEANL